MKGKHAAAVIIFVLLADQALKFYIKTNYYIGEEHNVLGSWFRLHFVENEGMAWGWKFGGDFGKILLTIFRFIAVVLGTFYLRSIIRKKYHAGFIICAALIYAGALGNLLDSMFYGLVFDNSYDPNNYNTYGIIARAFTGKGYGSFLHGKVVDMLYFPIITDAKYPSWFPVWGGEDFEFFRPVFNLADASISTGVITILLFQKKFFPKKEIQTATPVSAEIANDNIG